jgi:hypothetical protein
VEYTRKKIALKILGIYSMGRAFTNHQNGVGIIGLIMKPNVIKIAFVI